MWNGNNGPYCGVCHDIVSDSKVTTSKVEALEIRIAELINERNTYHQRLKESHLKTEEWRDKANNDSDRLDWIDKNMDCTLSGNGLHISSLEIGDDQTLRQAIDANREV